MENNRIQQIRQYVRDIPAMLEKKKQLEANLSPKERSIFSSTLEAESMNLQEQGSRSKNPFIV